MQSSMHSSEARPGRGKDAGRSRRSPPGKTAGRSSSKDRPPARSPRGAAARTPSRRAGADRLPGRQGREAPARLPDTARSLAASLPEIEPELAEIAAAAGCELLHAEWKGGVLRLILDRPAAAGEDQDPGRAGGVSLGDCEHVAKQASALLDVLDFGGGRYVLEVSSPGLDRQLYRPSDYRRFRGRLVRVTYETAGPEGRPSRRTVVARLAEISEVGAASEAGEAGAPGSGGADPVAVTLIEERTGERLTLRLETIRLARLEVEL
jgi:ribosome maturation factor RimP